MLTVAAIAGSAAAWVINSSLAPRQQRRPRARKTPAAAPAQGDQQCARLQTDGQLGSTGWSLLDGMTAASATQAAPKLQGRPPQFEGQRCLVHSAGRQGWLVRRLLLVCLGGAKLGLDVQGGLRKERLL